MRAALLEEVGRPLVVRDLPDPEPGPADLVLRVRASGVCGSDLHTSDTFVPPGGVMGHEFAGEVVDVGPDAGEWRIGDLVTGFPVSGCGKCGACLTGRTSKCPFAMQLGLQVPGAYAEYVKLGSREAYRLPAPLDARAGALVEPLAVALHALDRTTREPGEPVLVLGGGPVGQAVALWARALGASEVVVSDPVASRRAMAERIGAAAVDPTAEDVRSGFERIAGRPPRAVVECVGVPGLIQHAAEVTDVDGWVTVVGVCMQPDQLLPITALLKELTVQFVLYYRDTDFDTTIAMLANGRLDGMALVTDVIDLDALPERFEALKHPTGECKVLVEP